MKVLLCPRAKWPACYVIIPALLGSPSCPHFSLSSGVLLHLHSGQAIFVGPHWCNSRSSQMTDSRGFVAALFAVIVLPVSAVEKLEDSLPSSISNIWSTFSGPSLRERKALVEEFKKKTGSLFYDQIGFQLSFYTHHALVFLELLFQFHGKHLRPSLFFASHLEARCTWSWKHLSSADCQPQCHWKECSATGCEGEGTQFSRGCRSASFALWVHLITFANTPSSNTVTPHTPPQSSSQSCILTQFFFFSPSALQHVMGPPERIVVPLISPPGCTLTPLQQLCLSVYAAC